jgi:hypothetical protein
VNSRERAYFCADRLVNIDAGPADLVSIAIKTERDPPLERGLKNWLGYSRQMDEQEVSDSLVRLQ